MARYVLDASAGVELVNRTARGVELARRVFHHRAVRWTVEHFSVEVAKVIRRDTLRGMISDDTAGELVTALVNMPLNVARVAPLLPDAWTMRHNITIHDALYVALARHLDATLVTGDARLASAPGLDVHVLDD